MATCIRFLLPGSSRIECKNSPPPPGVHRGRCGWSYRPRTSDQVSPASCDTNKPAGSTPQYITSGSSGRARLICQTFLREAPESAGNFIWASLGLVQVLPKSSLDRKNVPQKLLVETHNLCRPFRPS